MSYVVVLQPQHCRNNIGLGCSAFARHYLRNHYCFLFLRLLRCFSSPGSPSDKSEYYAFSIVGCPIRKSPDRRLFAPPRSLSQLVTSFIASESLGIRRTPLVTLLTYYYSILFLSKIFYAFFQYVNELFRSPACIAFFASADSYNVCLLPSFKWRIRESNP